MPGKALVYLGLALYPTLWAIASDGPEADELPTLELLEFIGEWAIGEDEWFDPLPDKAVDTTTGDDNGES